MSYILDALKKAEQERDLGRVPRLEAMHDDAPRRARVLPWLIAGILLVNVAGLIWWLRPGVHTDVAAPVRQAPLAIAPTSPVIPPVTRVPTPVVAAPPVATAPVTEAAPRESVPAPVAPAPVAPSPIVPAAPALPVMPPVTRAPTPVVAAPPVATAPVTEAAPRESVPAPVAPAPTDVPLLSELPADFRATVPLLNLDVHVYASSAAGRFVLINMKKYHEGDQLAEGPRIEEITEEGVVLSYQGRKFRVARH